MEDMVSVVIRMLSEERSQRIKARKLLSKWLNISEDEAGRLAHDKFQNTGETINGNVWVRTAVSQSKKAA